jgi:two-component system chemotaxis response regulator CheY
MIDRLSPLTQSYLAESIEHFVSLEADLLAMERSGSQLDPELIHRAFRAVHTIKGGAAFFDLTRLPHLAHRMEDALGLIRSGIVVPTPDRVRALLSAADKLRDMLLDLESSDTVDTASVLALLGSFSPPSSPAIALAPAVQPNPAPTQPLRILLAEDDFTSRLVLQTFLCRYGQCHIATNGQEAVQAFADARLRGQPYHLACMDIAMPFMDGRATLFAIRDIEEAGQTPSADRCRVIMTSALDDVKNVVGSFRSLCDAYLVKPIDLHRLLELLTDFHLL